MSCFTKTALANQFITTVSRYELMSPLNFVQKILSNKINCTCLKIGFPCYCLQRFFTFENIFNTNNNKNSLKLAAIKIVINKKPITSYNKKQQQITRKKKFQRE